jgi:drug/metabolite transporter (DMT)-like permease
MNTPNQHTDSKQIEDIDNIKQAQTEMRNHHMSGATGIIVSGFVWLVTSFVAYSYSPENAVWTLLIGGALIHPVSTMLNKMIGVGGTHGKNNPLGSLAMEGTFFMLMCIPLAYVLSLQRTEWFFQGMLMIIGGRYLTFNTLFGNRLFWILGGVLGMAGYVLFSLNAQSTITALTGAVIEILFGFFVYFNVRRIIAKK